jgi:hypothetical protein
MHQRIRIKTNIDWQSTHRISRFSPGHSFTARDTNPHDTLFSSVKAHRWQQFIQRWMRNETTLDGYDIVTAALTEPDSLRSTGHAQRGAGRDHWQLCRFIEPNVGINNFAKPDK